MARKEEHHLFHDRVSWESRDTGKLIRRNRGLIVPLESDNHAELHEQTPVVPLLGYHALFQVAREYRSDGNNYLHNIELVQFAIEDAGNHPKAHPVEREIGKLACHVLDLQKPFIQDEYLRKVYL